MKTTTTLLAALCMGIAIELTRSGAAYDAYESVSYVRGYLGYAVAIGPAFCAGLLASWALLTDT